ncbi:MAG TPA: xanthine dehydrogenase family protein molybdopterin-binding subunit [Stellaceae bacterium]|jgi:carbon-monoxide dehydrogenase large subunit|nr:xanthine dehydrogenase family protein molybdopterin-binding subunit [Stellaceae bacterium]
MAGPEKRGNEFGIGKPVRRKEDLRLLTGRGRYTVDIDIPGQAHAVLLRSPHAHARVRRVDTARARALPGVFAIYTGADVLAAGMKRAGTDQEGFGPRHVQMLFPDVVLWNRDGSDMYPSPLLPLATDRAHYVGQGIAIVIADTIAAARDAAEAIAVEYEPLPAVTYAEDAAKPDAPRLWDQPSNVCLDAEAGDAVATAAAFARAAHVVRLKTWIQRVTGVTMEPRAAVAEYDAARDHVTLYAGAGAGAVRTKAGIDAILGWPPERLRVVAYDVGGNFGTRNAVYPESTLLAWAAHKLKRSIKWVAERSEGFAADYQGRDLVADTELALDRDGKFLAMRSRHLSNLGAHVLAIIPLRKAVGILSGVYDVKAGYVEARGVLSNTPSTVPYRSAGRPEAMFILERLIDIAARTHGFDRVELRRRNLIAPHALPYKNCTGVTYDSGEYERVMDEALALADANGFLARRMAAKARGKLLGLGIANYIESTTGIPRERAEVIVQPEGRVDVIIGTQSHGQGHETSFAQCISDWLGVDFDAVRLITGDTDIVPVGGGSNSGRSMRYAGVLMGYAVDEIVAKGKRIAAQLLEASPADIAFRDGGFAIEGTDRRLGLYEIAAAAAARGDLPEDLRGKLAAERDEVFKVAAYPYGTHVCEVEIDPETGAVELTRYAAVDDVGTAVNPMILHGQTHGAAAQGIGQALWEECFYDRASGQLLSGSLMDYALPRADGLPSFQTALSEVPCPTNRLGVRAGGEGGTTPALAVIVNAIVDALGEFGVEHIEMPVTPERVWRAIRGARA